jgi:hypothetical protein
MHRYARKFEKPEKVTYGRNFPPLRGVFQMRKAVAYEMAYFMCCNVFYRTMGNVPYVFQKVPYGCDFPFYGVWTDTFDFD